MCEFNQQVVCAYLDVIPPELQQGGQTSLDLAEELVEEGQLSDSVLIQQGAQTWQGEHQTHSPHQKS